MPKDFLVVRFLVEKGPVIREIINKSDLVHHTKSEKDGNSIELELDICGPDSDDEGSRTRFRYDVDGMVLQLENAGASVEKRMAELIK